MLIALLVVPRQDCGLPALAATLQPPRMQGIESIICKVTVVKLKIMRHHWQLMGVVTVETPLLLSSIYKGVQSLPT